MTAQTRQELRAIAEAATQGEWELEESSVYLKQDPSKRYSVLAWATVEGHDDESNAAHIAACDNGCDECYEHGTQGGVL